MLVEAYLRSRIHALVVPTAKSFCLYNIHHWFPNCDLQPTNTSIFSLRHIDGLLGFTLLAKLCMIVWLSIRMLSRMANSSLSFITFHGKTRSCILTQYKFSLVLISHFTYLQFPVIIRLKPRIHWRFGIHDYGFSLVVLILRGYFST